MPDFETIYQQYFRFVWSSVRRLGVEEAATDDVVQEVFIVIHSKLCTLNKPESLRSWIYGIVRRTASAHRRTRQAKGGVFTSSASDASSLPSRDPNPLDRTEQSSQVGLLFRLLDGLSEAKREVFILAELEEMTAPEISEALEVPLNTVYSRLRHAREEFEAALARENARAKKVGGLS